jgi:AcrR family transcriptional regulator
MPEPVAQPQPVPASGRREQPRGRLRAAQREFTRARIVEAAIEVFAEKGYARTTVDDIASRAGSTRATFYLHFRSKSEILTDLMARSEQHYHRIYQQLSAVVAEHPTLPGVRTWLSLAMSEWRSIASLSRPVHEAATIEPEVSELNSARYNAQIAELAQALRGGAPSLGSADAEVYASILLAPLSYYFQQFLQGTVFDERRVLDAMASAWMAILADIAKDPG